MDFYNFVDESNRCNNSDELTVLFLKALDQYGLSKFIYSRVQQSSLAPNTRHHGIVNAYPMDWMEHYQKNNYFDSDATVRFCRNSNGSVDWDNIDKVINLLDHEKTVFSEAREAGLKKGLTVSIHGPGGEIYGLGIASSFRKEDYSRNEVSIINALANQFHATCERLGLAPRPVLPTLTKRQQEVLKWTAAGKTGTVIAEIIGVSEDTVRHHFREVFRKLDCNDRMTAVLKALQAGLISL